MARVQMSYSEFCMLNNDGNFIIRNPEPILKDALDIFRVIGQCLGGYPRMQRYVEKWTHRSPRKRQAGWDWIVENFKRN